MSDPFDLNEDELDLEHDESIEDAGEPEGQESADADGQRDDETIALRAELEAIKREKEAERLAEQRAQAEWQAKQEADQLEAKERELTEKRKAALESDDLDAEAKFNDELIDVKLKRKAVAELRQQEATPTQSAEDHLTPAARAWLQLNPEFYSDKDYKARVLAVNGELQKAGMKVDDPKFYRELDKRLNEASKPKQKHGQVAGVSRGSAMNAGNKPASQSKLTSDDLRKMRKYGLDTSNPDHRRGWLNRNRVPMN